MGVLTTAQRATLWRAHEKLAKDRV